MIKKVMKAGYAHKSNVAELIEKKIPQELHEKFKKFMEAVNEKGILYDIIKYDSGNVTLITSPDWDTANEPVVGICMRWKAGEWLTPDGKLNMQYKTTENFRQIYHNKWQFVADGYKGFDIEAAKRRTAEWNAIPDLNKNKIGNKSYWEKLMSENGMEI